MKNIFELLLEIQKLNEKMEKDKKEAWKETRDNMIKELQDCDTQEKFEEYIQFMRKKFQLAETMTEMFKEGLEDALKESIKKDIKNKKN